MILATSVQGNSDYSYEQEDSGNVHGSRGRLYRAKPPKMIILSIKEDTAIGLEYFERDNREENFIPPDNFETSEAHVRLFW